MTAPNLLAYGPTPLPRTHTRRRARARRPLAVLALVATLTGLTAGCGGAAPRFVAGSAASEPAGSPAAPSPVTEPAAGPSVAAPAAASAAPNPAPPGSAVTVPPGVTAGVAVFDRQTGGFTAEHNVTMRFRSASLVKLLIALDYLWDRGPAYAIPAADRGRFDLMLRRSDDNAATYFWKASGSGAVVTRMVGRLGLKDTLPPSGSRLGWGSTAVSPADLVRVYRYLLDSAPAPVRDHIMGSLRQASNCGTDGFDQTFGIPTAFQRPWAVKQGWYEFGGKPASPCVAQAALSSDAARPADAGLTPAALPAPAALPVPAAPAAPARNNVDWTGEVLHTTGTVGAGDRTIVVVLTVHRRGTPFATAAAVLTKLAGSLPVPR